jgi:uncharacterized protein (TIGR03437 family)
MTSTPDAVTKVYPTTISPDAVSATQRNLWVTFYQTGTSTVLGVAPVLFATNNQINVLVPSGVSSQIGSNVDVVVRFGYGTAAATLKTSAVTQVKVVATNPGIFTVGADGQGDGAVLDGNCLDQSIQSQRHSIGRKRFGLRSDLYDWPGNSGQRRRQLYRWNRTGSACRLCIDRFLYDVPKFADGRVTYGG